MLVSLDILTCLSLDSAVFMRTIILLMVTALIWKLLVVSSLYVVELATSLCSQKHVFSSQLLSGFCAFRNKLCNMFNTWCPLSVFCCWSFFVFFSPSSRDVCFPQGCFSDYSPGKWNKSDSFCFLASFLHAIYLRYLAIDGNYSGSFCFSFSCPCWCESCWPLQGASFQAVALLCELIVATDLFLWKGHSPCEGIMDPLHVLCW